MRSTDFRRVYDKGVRLPGPIFAAFCLARQDRTGPRIGFTVSKAVGKAVERNRVRRRLREAVRVRLGRFGSQWDVVLNARRAALMAPFPAIERAMERLVERCGR